MRTCPRTDEVLRKHAQRYLEMCQECSGTGEVELEDTVGGYTENGPWQSYRVRFYECPSCEGRGDVEAD